MKQRVGGLLSLALGAVFIVGGTVGSGGTGTVGAIQCGVSVVGTPNPCPVGTITISEQTAVAPAAKSGSAGFAADAKAAAPATWTVTVTSTNCLSTTGAPVNQQVTVPTNGSAAPTADLFVYEYRNSTMTKCSYALTQTPVAGYTATFDPPSPVTLPDPPPRSADNLAVTLTDTAAAATSTSSAPSSSTSSAPSSAASSSTARRSASASATVISASASNSAAPLANTGPRSSITFSLLAGIALCLLGLVLLFAGRWPVGSARRRR